MDPEGLPGLEKELEQEQEQEQEQYKQQIRCWTYPGVKGVPLLQVQEVGLVPAPQGFLDRSRSKSRRKRSKRSKIRR